MSDRTVAHHWFAFDDFGDEIHLLIRKRDANAFAERAGVATDGNHAPVVVGANGDVARNTQKPFTARFNGNAIVTSPAEHRHLERELVGAMIAPPLRGIHGKEGAALEPRRSVHAETEFHRNRLGSAVRVARTCELCLPGNRIDERVFSGQSDERSSISR